MNNLPPLPNICITCGSYMQDRSKDEPCISCWQFDGWTEFDWHTANTSQQITVLWYIVLQQTEEIKQLREDVYKLKKE